MSPRYKYGLDKQIEQLRTKWPQANVEQPKGGNQYALHLVALPGILLPKAYTAEICTALFLTKLGDDGLTASPLDGFWVDIPRLGYKESPWHIPYTHSDADTNIPGFPQWRELTRFHYRAQAHSLTDTLYTAAMLVRQRLRRVLRVSDDRP